MRRAALFVLTGYHQIISPLLPTACRFYPSCSVYTAQALERHGFVRGLWLGLCRLVRCNPLHAGGYDPLR